MIKIAIEDINEGSNMSEINLDELGDMFIKNMKGEITSQPIEMDDKDLDNYLVSDDGIVAKNKMNDFSQSILSKNELVLNNFNQPVNQNFQPSDFSTSPSDIVPQDLFEQENTKSETNENHVEKKKRGRKKIDPALKKKPQPYVKKKDRIHYEKNEQLSLILPPCIEEAIDKGFVVILQPDAYYIEGFYEQSHEKAFLKGFVRLQESETSTILIGVDKKGIEHRLETFDDLLQFNHVIWMNCYKSPEHRKPDLKWFPFLFEKGLVSISPK